MLHGWSHFCAPAPTVEALGLVVLGTGAQQGEVPAVVSRTLPYHAVVLIEGGRGTARIGPALPATPVGRGCLVWLPPGLVHSYRPDAGGWVERWILFEGRDAAGYTVAGALSADGSIVTAPAGPVRDAFDAVTRAIAPDGPVRLRGPDDSSTGDRDDIASGLRAAAALHRLIVHFGRLSTTSRRDRVLEAVATASTVTEAAVRLGMTLAEVHAHVQTRTGSTPKRYQLDQRLSRAKGMLVDSEASIGEIAAANGWGDPAYFSRVFARRVGSTPTRFRTLHRRT